MNRPTAQTETTFSVQLGGILLPDSVKKQIEAQMRSVVLGEVAKTDLGAQITTEPLARSSERFTRGEILGFIVRAGTRAAGTLAERSAMSGIAAPSLFYTLPDHVQKALQLLGGTQGPTAEALETLYSRPDFREATISVSRLLAVALSRDEHAVHALDELTGGALHGDSQVERNPVLIAGLAVGGALAVGFILGAVINKPK